MEGGGGEGGGAIHERELNILEDAISLQYLSQYTLKLHNDGKGDVRQWYKFNASKIGKDFAYILPISIPCLPDAGISILVHKRYEVQLHMIIHRILVELIHRVLFV